MSSFDTMMVALKFNEKINEQGLEGLAALTTDDRLLRVNSLDPTRGKASVKEGWRLLFRRNPDCKNVCTNVTVQEDDVVTPRDLLI